MTDFVQDFRLNDRAFEFLLRSGRYSANRRPPVFMPERRSFDPVSVSVGVVQNRSEGRACPFLNVQIGNVKSIGLNELSAWFDHISHQGGEDLLCLIGMFNPDLKE